MNFLSMFFIPLLNLQGNILLLPPQPLSPLLSFSFLSKLLIWEKSSRTKVSGKDFDICFEYYKDIHF